MHVETTEIPIAFSSSLESTKSDKFTSKLLQKLYKTVFYGITAPKITKLSECQLTTQSFIFTAKIHVCRFKS